MKLLIGYLGIVGTVLFLMIWGASLVMTQAANNSDRMQAAQARAARALRAEVNNNSLQKKREDMMKLATTRREQENTRPPVQSKSVQKESPIASIAPADALRTLPAAPQAMALQTTSSQTTASVPPSPPLQTLAASKRSAKTRHLAVRNKASLQRARAYSRERRETVRPDRDETREFRDTRREDRADRRELAQVRRAYVDGARRYPDEYLELRESREPFAAPPDRVVEDLNVPFLDIFD